MSKPRIDEIERAIIARIRAMMPKVNKVEGVDDSNLDSQTGEILVPAPGILVAYSTRNLRPRDITGKRYGKSLYFSLIVLAQNFRSRGDERMDAYGMLEDLDTIFAGEILTLEGGAQVHCWLADGEGFMGLLRAGGVAYGAAIEVRGNWDNVV